MVERAQHLHQQPPHQNLMAQEAQTNQPLHSPTQAQGFQSLSQIIVRQIRLQLPRLLNQAQLPPNFGETKTKTAGAAVGTFLPNNSFYNEQH